MTSRPYMAKDAGSGLEENGPCKCATQVQRWQLESGSLKSGHNPLETPSASKSAKHLQHQKQQNFEIICTARAKKDDLKERLNHKAVQRADAANMDSGRRTKDHSLLFSHSLRAIFFNNLKYI